MTQPCLMQTGWATENFQCCIAFAWVPHRETFEDIQGVLQLSTETDSLCSVRYCGGGSPPMILGEWIPQLNSDYLPERKCQQASVWMTLTLDAHQRNPKMKLPKLHSFYSCGYLYRTSCYLIEYKPIRTDKLQYLEPGQHLFLQSTSFDQSMSQINAAHDLFIFLNKALPSSTLRHHFSIDITAWWYLAHIPFLFAWIWHMIAYMTMTLCTVPIPVYLPGYHARIRLREISHLCDSLYINSSCHLRSIKWCALFSTSWARPPKVRQILWLRLSGFVVFVLLDVTCGCLLGGYVLKHADEIIDFSLTRAAYLEQKLLTEQLVWFNHAPGGVQLNPLLTRHFVETSTTFFDVCRHLHSLVTTAAIPILKTFACFGALGLSTQLALAIDIFRLVSLHVTFVYFVVSLLHRIQMSMLFSLWYLFYGKKINVLRERIDSYHYDKEQLLLGTALFAILAFLFPTFTAFYLLFLFLRILVVGFQLFLWCFIVGIRHFPIYKIWLSFAFPTSQTNGVKFAFNAGVTSSDTISNSTTEPIAGNTSHASHTIDSLPTANGVVYSRPLRLHAFSLFKGDHRRRWGRGILSSSSSPALINEDDSDGFIRTPEAVDVDFEEDSQLTDGEYDYTKDESLRVKRQGLRSTNVAPKISNGINIHMKLSYKTRSIFQILNLSRLVNYSTFESSIKHIGRILVGSDFLRLETFKNMLPRLEIGSVDEEDDITSDGDSEQDSTFWGNIALGFGNLRARHVPLSLLKQQSANRYILLVLTISQVMCLFAATLGSVFLANELAPVSRPGVAQQLEVVRAAQFVSADVNIAARLLAVIGSIAS